MNRVKVHVKKGDSVLVTSGAHKGSSGKVLQVLPKKSQVFVEGVRIIKKHQKKSQDNPQGAIIQREGPIHISNVKFADKAEKTTKVAKPKTEKPKKKTA